MGDEKVQGMHHGTFQHRAPQTATCYADVLWNVVVNSGAATQVVLWTGTCYAGVRWNDVRNLPAIVTCYARVSWTVVEHRE